MNSHHKSARWLIAFTSTVSWVLLSAATTQSQCIDPPANLVLRYSLDETSVAPGARDFVSGIYSPLVANTASGGIIPTVAFVPGHPGTPQSGAFFFDFDKKWLNPTTPGTVGYFLAPNSTPTDFGKNQNFSIDFWVYDMGCFDPLRTSAPSVLVPCLVYWMGTGAQGTGWRITTTWPEGHLALELFQPSASSLQVPLAVFPLNTWVHIAITVDRQGPITTYIDGNVVNTQTVATNAIDLTSGRYLVIGGAYWDPGAMTPPTPQARARGYLEELEIYSRVLTPDEVLDIATKGKCKPLPATAKGMTWERRAVNATNGTVTVGCVGGPSVCNPYLGDTLCSTSLPVLCFKPSGFQKPAFVIDTSIYNRWSGGIVATTSPVAASSFGGSLANAHAMCEQELGAGWRVAEFHDGWGWNFQAYGNVGTLANRFWVHINDQPNGRCWGP